MRPQCPYRFRLFVAGDTENSALAIANFADICSTHFGADCDTEIVDVIEHPRRALEDKILMTPTLVRIAPAPHRRIVGTLSQVQIVVRMMELDGTVA